MQSSESTSTLKWEVAILQSDSDCEEKLQKFNAERKVPDIK